MAFNDTIVGGGGELIRDEIHSRGYVPGVSGWRIGRDGSADFSGGQFRGAVLVGPSNASQVLIRNDGLRGVVEFPNNRPQERPGYVASASVNKGTPQEYAQVLMSSPWWTFSDDRVYQVFNSQNLNATSDANYGLWHTDGVTDTFLMSAGPDDITVKRELRLESPNLFKHGFPGAAPNSYVHVFDGAGHTFTTGQTTGAFFSFGGPSFGVTIPAGGEYILSFGMTGYNMASSTAQIRVCPMITGGGSPFNPTTGSSACVTVGAAVAAPNTVHRQFPRTDAVGGGAVFELMAYVSAIGVNSAVIETCWLTLEPTNF